MTTLLQDGKTSAHLEIDVIDTVANKKVEDAMLKMWKRREMDLDKLFHEIKPVSSDEKFGHFSTEMFRIGTHIEESNTLKDQSSIRLMGIFSSKSDSGASSFSGTDGDSAQFSGVVSAVDTSEARKNDKYLDRILRPLQGRESSILSTSSRFVNESGVEDQNMAAWVIYKVRCIFV